jgi:hypothetical protein
MTYHLGRRLDRPADRRPTNRQPIKRHHQENSPMLYDHRSTDIRRAEIDREIEMIQMERLIVAGRRHADGIVERARRATGRVLIAAGTALIGREAALRTHRI